MPDFGYEQQTEVLAKCIEVAKAFGTDRVRGFDFWRLEDQAAYRKAINAKLQEGAAELSKHGIYLCVGKRIRVQHSHR